MIVFLYISQQLPFKCLVFKMPSFVAVINNVKISADATQSQNIKTEIERLSHHPCVLKRNNSFFILRRYSYVYTLFRTGHINVTKIRHPKHIERAVQLICDDLNISETLSYRIDNMTASGDLAKLSDITIATPLCLRLISVEVSNNLDSYKVGSVRFDTQTFPACYFKCKSGTISLFNTGKFNLVGLRSQEDVVILCSILQGILKCLIAPTRK